MSNLLIESIRTVDARYSLQPGEGTDAVHSDPEYCMAVTRLLTNKKTSGSGIALSLGEGNRLICEAIDMLARPLVGVEIEDVMAEFGAIARSMADHYVEISFATGSSTLDPNQTSSNIIVTVDRLSGVYSEANDYSYNVAKFWPTFSEWTHVTLYRNGTLVYGTEP